MECNELYYTVSPLHRRCALGVMRLWKIGHFFRIKVMATLELGLDI